MYFSQLWKLEVQDHVASTVVFQGHLCFQPNWDFLKVEGALLVIHQDSGHSPGPSLANGKLRAP